ncbi:hypothetical protein AYI70_g3664, partial [Smittium culicis]
MDVLNYIGLTSSRCPDVLSTCTRCPTFKTSHWLFSHFNQIEWMS